MLLRASLVEVAMSRMEVVLFQGASDVVGLDPPFSDVRVGVRMGVVGIGTVGVVGRMDVERSVICSGAGRK